MNDDSQIGTNQKVISAFNIEDPLPESRDNKEENKETPAGLGSAITGFANNLFGSGVENNPPPVK